MRRTKLSWGFIILDKGYCRVIIATIIITVLQTAEVC